jgi:sialic acid synthase SpsE
MILILDCGSANTCQNDKATVEKMIKEIAYVDSGRHQVYLKWQLFKDAPPNIPLDHDVFRHAYEYADRFAYQTTASVFDLESMRFLMGFDVPFVKIANRPDLYYLAEYSTVPVYVSTSQSGFDLPNGEINLACISNYPATLEMYEDAFTMDELRYISDHTPGWDLYRKYLPKIIEKHYVHERRLDNPDAGMFAVTPTELAEVL